MNKTKKADYDYYDYQKYWKGRQYEHESEKIAIEQLLKNIARKDLTTVEIGAGFGRLANSYNHKSKKIILTDPSTNLLKIAKSELKNINSNKIEFVECKAEYVCKNVKKLSADLVVMVRVLHHIKNPEQVFKEIRKIIKPGGYLLLEFANKGHAKAMFKRLCSGDTTFNWDIFPIDIRSKFNRKKKTIPFYNYQADYVIQALTNSGFEIIEKRSVSNLRNNKIKKLLSCSSLLSLEKKLQKPFACLHWGPSFFILATRK